MEIINISEKIHGALFYAFKHCSMATAKFGYESMYKLDFIKVEENKIIASDGHRLHIAKAQHALEKGMYRIIKNTAWKMTLHREMDGDLQYPEWKAIVKSADIDNLEFTKLSEDIDYSYGIIYHYLESKETLRSLDHKFVLDALRFSGGHFSTKNEMAIFKDGDFTSIIMLKLVR